MKRKSFSALRWSTEALFKRGVRSVFGAGLDTIVKGQLVAGADVPLGKHGHSGNETFYPDGAGCQVRVARVVEVPADVPDRRRVDDCLDRTFFAEIFADPENEVVPSAIPVVLVATLGLLLADYFAWSKDQKLTGLLQLPPKTRGEQAPLILTQPSFEGLKSFVQPVAFYLFVVRKQSFFKTNLSKNLINKNALLAVVYLLYLEVFPTPVVLFQAC